MGRAVPRDGGHDRLLATREVVVVGPGRDPGGVGDVFDADVLGPNPSRSPSPDSAQQPGAAPATWHHAAWRSSSTTPATHAPLRLNAVYERDEAGQAAYLRKLLDIFDGEGVDGAFVHLFALRNLPHRPDGDPRDDLDLASLGIVKVLEGRTGNAFPGLPWEPKAAFAAIAEHYSRPRSAQQPT
ncbi:hypothetical protein [Dactylosporangium matsuzakiense]|uniref:Uncharacterized protein n=1 Tax=Dactylosporangium matsuzakiense TaxID=53360 RepID=A0A9W6KUC0_9ACTN|nr:hypothetical protein [Dactylosporangium matsuzakiense]GLL05619.1 hypothetical protein GCM10017581_073660 [Dactylosporangium matsuzakiense]